MKLNIAERKIGQLIQIFKTFPITRESNKITEDVSIIKDVIRNKFSSTQLRIIRDNIVIINNFSKYKRHKIENGKIRSLKKE